MLKYYFFLFFLLLKLSFFTYSQTWNTLDNGVSNLVNTLCEYQNELYVGGNFTSAGTLSANYIARWNGTNWNALNSGQAQLSSEVLSMVVYDGELYVAGYFGISSLNTGRIAKWNGTSWSAVMTNNFINGYIFCMVVYNNELYVAGNIYKINNVNVNRIAKWNGSQWSDVGGGVTGGGGPTQIATMCVYNNKLYVGGIFSKAGTIQVNNIASWNGTAWDSCGSGLQGYVNSMVVDSLNNIFYVGGTLTDAGGIPVRVAAQWDGNNWSATGWGITTGGLDMTMYNNKLYVCCQSANGLTTDTALACWDGTSWKPILGPDNTITSLKVFSNKLYIGGYFTNVNSLQANRIVSYDEQINVIEIDKENNNYIKEIIPNPTNEFTLISYILPPNAVNSVIQIFDSAGQSVAIYSLSKAMTSIKIEVKDFPQGIYSLSLVTDSNVIDTGKMVVVK